MVNEQWLHAGIGLVAGTGLGWLYFSALWMVVRRLQAGTSATYAAAALALSGIVRLIVALGLFYWLATVSVTSLIAGIAAFTLIAFAAAAERLRSKG